MLAPERIKAPVPEVVRPKVPAASSITPENSSESAVVTRFAAEMSVMSPVRTLSPEMFSMVADPPALPMVIASSTVCGPAPRSNFSVAPSLTVVPPAIAPKPVRLATTRMPLCTFVGPR